MKIKKQNLKIIAACSVAIFSLAALLGGTFAWFTLTMATQSEVDEFVVINNGHCDLFSANLVKFDYHKTTYGSGDYQFTAIDYLNPQNGAVNKYAYNPETHTFGYEEESEWVNVSIMNTYDPYDKIIFGSSLKDLNCNALYEFTVNADDFDEAYLNATAMRLTEKTKQEDEVFLTSCVNFDIFVASDLSDDNPAFIEQDDPETPEVESGNKAYYPSYIDKSETLTANEDIYYKLSYLASLKNSHAHFYGDTADEITIDSNKEVTFLPNTDLGTKQVTFYVNVNYEPDELDYLTTKIYLGNVKAVFDFMFKFDFAERGNS